MTKYIDAEKLREKITEQMDTLPREVGRGAGTITSKGYGMMQAFQIVRSIIDSLQQEQQGVDLEEEIQMEWDSFNYHLAEYGNEREEVVWLNHNSFWDVARYFYELGFNARKEK